MARGIRGLSCGWLIAFAMLAITAAPAPGAYTIGSNLRHAPEAGICETEAAGEHPCTLAQSWLAYGRVSPAGLTSPMEGVVTRWAVVVGSPTPATTGLKLQLRTLSGPFGGATGRTMDIPLPAPGTMSYLSFPGEHLPIQHGQAIGLTALLSGNGSGKAAVPMIATGPELGAVGYWERALPEGDSGFGESRPDAELLLQAEVEPDVDRDGLGDETQDDCSSGLPPRCPLVDRTAPSTAISFERTQGFLRSGRIVVRQRSSDAGRAYAEGVLEIRGKKGWTYSLGVDRTGVRAGKTVRLAVRVPKNARRAAAKAVHQGRKVVAELNVGAADAAGNETAQAIVVRPKRP